MEYPYASSRADAASIVPPVGGFEAFWDDGVADIEQEVRCLLDVDGTLGTTLGVAEFD